MFDSDIDNYKFLLTKEFEKYDVIGIGPGLGIDKKTQNAFFELVATYKKPMLIDARSQLNILSLNKSYIRYILKIVF